DEAGYHDPFLTTREFGADPRDPIRGDAGDDGRCTGRVHGRGHVGQVRVGQASHELGRLVRVDEFGGSGREQGRKGVFGDLRGEWDRDRLGQGRDLGEPRSVGLEQRIGDLAAQDAQVGRRHRGERGEAIGVAAEDVRELAQLAGHLGWNVRAHVPSTFLTMPRTGNGTWRIDASYAACMYRACWRNASEITSASNTRAA